MRWEGSQAEEYNKKGEQIIVGREEEANIQ
jgi:hypothetical protein